VKIIALAPLKKFWTLHNQAEQPLKAWIDEVKKASWQTPQDIKRRYPSADFLPKNRVIFQIKGNDYRLIAAVAYRFQAVYVKFVGTHSEYDRIDAETVET